MRQRCLPSGWNTCRRRHRPHRRCRRCCTSCRRIRWRCHRRCPRRQRRHDRQRCGRPTRRGPVLRYRPRAKWPTLRPTRPETPHGWRRRWQRLWWLRRRRWWRRRRYGGRDPRSPPVGRCVAGGVTHDGPGCGSGAAAAARVADAVADVALVAIELSADGGGGDGGGVESGGGGGGGGRDRPATGTADETFTAAAFRAPVAEAKAAHRRRCSTKKALAAAAARLDDTHTRRVDINSHRAEAFFGAALRLSRTADREATATVKAAGEGCPGGYGGAKAGQMEQVRVGVFLK